MTHINPDGKGVGGEQPKEMLLLHIYSQPYEHSEARIIGNMAGLRQLIQTIEASILSGEEAKSDVLFATDGEGYEVLIRLMPDNWHDSEWDKVEYQPHYCDRGYADDLHKE